MDQHVSAPIERSDAFQGAFISILCLSVGLLPLANAYLSGKMSGLVLFLALAVISAGAVPAWLALRPLTRKHRKKSMRVFFPATMAVMVSAAITVPAGTMLAVSFFA